MPKLELVLGILSEFCIDNREKVMGASKLGGKVAACSHSGILPLQYVSSYFLGHFLLLFRESRK